MVNQGVDQEVLNMPPGFRFHPTNVEIIIHYLKEKVFNIEFTAAAIGQADLNKIEPWDLPKIAKMGEKEFYFFCQRDRKYPTGMRTNRATASGYWKATGRDKEIFRGKSCLVGMKKTLVFYRGRAPKGVKTTWVMHEYRLDGMYSYHNLPESARDEWVVCRVFDKKAPIPTTTTTNQFSRIDSFHNIDHLLDFSSLPPPIDPVFSDQASPSFSGPSHKPVQHHPTTAPVDNTYFPIPYHTVHNPKSDSRNLTGNNKSKDVIKLEHSVVSASQETGLSSEVNIAATPEISSYPPMMMNSTMIDGSKSAWDDLDDLIFWDDLI